MIFFHAGFKPFSGGFVGVDIFFVISGYLITSILLSDLQENRFSIARFYERRARRILPALFTVMVVSLLLAWAWLMPADMKSFCKSLVAVSLFFSNIFFWGESGYFNSAAEFKPALHTWSLAVEEQFYLLFPVMLALAWRLGRGAAAALMGMVFLASLAAAQWGAQHAPEAAFFLIHARAWELALGALLAFYFMQRGQPTGAALNQLGSAAGLALIAFSVLSYDDKTPFPGLWALVPTVGAALVILHAGPRTLAGRLLGSRVFVALGLLSYSAYLWHQPLFAFARHLATEEPAPATFALLSLLSLGLAALSWRFVEQPVRGNAALSRKQVFAWAAGASAVLIAIGVTGSLTNGFGFRFTNRHPAMAPLAQITDVYTHYDYRQVVRNEVCHSVGVEVMRRNGCVDRRASNLLLWGDSYAASLYTGLEKMRSEKYATFGITQLTDGNGPPFVAPGKTDDGKTLAQADENRLAVARELQPEVVVLAWYLNGKNALKTKEASLQALNATVSRILEASPHSRIIVVGPFPRWAGTLHKVLLEYAARHDTVPPAYMRYGLLAKDSDWDAYFRQNVPRDQVEYLSAQDILCNAKGCLTRLSDDVTDITAVDFGHLTMNASIYLARRIDQQVFLGARP